MLHYRVEGNGPPLLMIHGWGVTFAIWQTLAPLLNTHFQLIMVELPGVGDSPMFEPEQPYYQACAEEIEAVRQELGITQWSLLAYSTGTRAAEAYVQRYPQTIRDVVFLCPIYLPEIWAFFLRLLATPHPQMLTQWVFSDWRLHNLILALGFNWKRSAYTRTWIDEIELQPLDTLVRSLCDLPGKGRQPFQVLGVPTLFIWGRHDVLTKRPRRLRPNDVLILADHSAPMQAAQSVAEIVIPFLDKGKIVSTTPIAQQKQKRLWLRRPQETSPTTIEKNARIRTLLRKFERQRLLRRKREAQTRRRTRPLS
jgi:pimeloyl-ACP methyl ester carboxylesterase